MNRVAERDKEALRRRIEQDGAASMDDVQWRTWVDHLPVGEFMVMIDLSTKENGNG